MCNRIEALPSAARPSACHLRIMKLDSSPIMELDLRKWGSWHEKKKIGKKIGELKFAKKKNWQSGKK